MVDAMTASGDRVSRSGLSRVIATATSLDTDDANGLVAAFIGAHNIRQRRMASADAIAAGIAADKELRLEESELSTLMERFRLVLENSHLALLSRATDIADLDERSFCTARVISDIRPVFAHESDPPEPAGAVIHHTLKIDYHVDGSAKVDSIRMTIDDRGARVLLDVLRRTAEKSTAMRNLLEQSGIQVIELEEHHR